ncbi:DJ-1/PfpI family protein [Streptacidiphilus sp. PAMC 29251]
MTSATETETTTVHLSVYEGFADWEPALAVAQIRSGSFQPGGAARHRIRIVGESREPVRSMGGLLVTPELTLDELDPADSALLIVPGGGGWHDGDRHAAFPRKARAFLEAAVPVAAICDGTVGLAREGLLDDRDHTSSDGGYLAASSGYRGSERYREADAVRDRGLITAGPTDPVAFAREIFAELGLWSPEVLAAWFRLFSRSDPTAYADLIRLTTAA